jgi:hypothetical protein
MARRSRRATLLARSSDGRNRSVNRTGLFSLSTGTEYRTGDAKEGRPLRADPLVVRSGYRVLVGATVATERPAQDDEIVGDRIIGVARVTALIAQDRLLDVLVVVRI